MGWTNYETEVAARSCAIAAANQAASLRRKEMLKNGEAGRLVDDLVSARGVEFEVRGWDVVIRGPLWMNGFLWVELKPQLGDDYPVVLRTIKGRQADGPRALIVDRFEAEGATLDDVKWTFGQSRIAVRTLAEIRALMPAKA